MLLGFLVWGGLQPLVWSMVSQALRGWGGKRRWSLGNEGLEVEIYIQKSTYVQVGDIASAEGAKLRLPKARSPFRLRKLPSGVWGGSPETDVILNISCQMEYIFGSCKISYFLTITSKI